ncbi:response regulator [Candidatus Sumerlaeota bacterium]|nr:response regulator [Candidatus Sumerlaeota bacterium]
MESIEAINVLVVDDNPVNLRMLEHQLKALGVAVFTAQSGAEALKMLPKKGFAIILLDVQMPGMNGFETAEIIRNSKHSQNIPIIFITAEDRNDETVFKGYGSGAVDFLFKPVNAHILRSKVRVFVDLYRQRLLIDQDRIEAEANRKKMTEQFYELQERMKEQTCMYRVAESIHSRATLAEIVNDILMLIPRGWERSEFVRCKIWIDGKEHVAEPFEETGWKQRADIVINHENRGAIEVFYTQQLPEMERILSHEEKQILLKNIAENLSEAINKHNIASELEQTAKFLQDSEMKFRTIVENINVGILLVDSNTRILEINRQIRDWFPHIRVEEHPFCHEAVNVKLQDLPAGKSSTQKALKEGAIQEAMIEIKVNGAPAQYRVVSTPIHDAGGEVVASIVMMEDLTERMAMEKQLSQSQKLESIGQLAAGIAHEINTPAQFIGDNTRFLEQSFRDIIKILEKYAALKDAAGDGAVPQELIDELDTLIDEYDLEFLSDEIPTAIERSLVGIERVTKIVRAMKDFSHPGGDESTLFDINKAIESTVTVARNEWKYVSDLELELQENLPLTPCYPGVFNQAILNMIVNAAQAIAERRDREETKKGKIRITTRAAGDWVEIRISDTGVGIPESIRDKIFDHFFTTKSIGKGTGQGLSIAYSAIVEQHEGTIDVESEVGKGTTFIVRLPLKKNGQ